MSSRSYEDKQAGQQIYAVIEFCSNPATAWGKIESGQYDWLGMKRETFVFGRPPVPKGFTAYGAGTAIHKAADGSRPDGRHVVEIRIPNSRPPARSIYPTAEDARSGYQSTIARLRTPDGGSGLWKVRLIVDNILEDEQFVVRTLPNVL